MIAQPNQIKTAREAFDFITKHLYEQGGRSIGWTGCQYRGDNGFSCAVGCLIPESFYQEDLEGKNVNDYEILHVLQDAHPNLEMTENTVAMLKKLQHIHDNVDPDEWEFEFSEILDNYLTLPDRSAIHHNAYPE